MSVPEGGGLIGMADSSLCAPLSSALASLLPLLDLAVVGSPCTPALASANCLLCGFGRRQVAQMVAVEVSDERGLLAAVSTPW